MDRQRAIDVFNEYVSHYDSENPMIRDKAAHTFRVAEAAEQIARSHDLRHGAPLRSQVRTSFSSGYQSVTLLYGLRTGIPHQPGNSGQTGLSA